MNYLGGLHIITQTLTIREHPPEEEAREMQQHRKREQSEMRERQSHQPLAEHQDCSHEKQSSTNNIGKFGSRFLPRTSFNNHSSVNVLNLTQ